MIAAKLRQLASYATRVRGSVSGMDETPSALAERRGLRGAEAAAVLRFGLEEDDGAPQGEGVGEHLHTDPSLSAADSVASERRSVRTMAVGGVTLTVLAAAVIGFPHSGPDPTYVGAGRGSVIGPEVKAAGGSVGHPRDDTHKEQAQMSTLRNSIQASVVAGATIVAVSAGAQSAAVQWTVSEGGNGHWYEIRLVADEETWFTCRDNAIAIGGHLATIASNAENNFVFSLASQTPGGFSGNQIQVGPFLGGYQPDGSDEPAGGWRWVTEEPWGFTNWADGGGQPDNAMHCGQAPGDRPGEHYLQFIYASPSWNDMSAAATCYGGSKPSYAVEWSTDCNSDGIVDYGQCHDGTLADFNGNNTPDCCERGETCVVGSYPVQWRLDDGGNGHWYSVTAERGTWQHDRERAQSVGGDLATVTSEAESTYLCSAVMNAGPWATEACWMGMKLGSNGAFQWVSGEPVTWTNWYPSVPHNPPFEVVWITGPRNPGGANPCFWNDADPSPLIGHTYFGLIEWSADCNHDNIVDYGQILTGRLADANTNGIPDVCEVPTCRDVDLFRDDVVNGADLGILLAQWGVANANTISDINHDGQVNGSDLGTLLAFWGPCSP